MEIASTQHNFDSLFGNYHSDSDTCIAGIEQLVRTLLLRGKNGRSVKVEIWKCRCEVGVSFRADYQEEMGDGSIYTDYPDLSGAATEYDAVSQCLSLVDDRWR